MILLNYKAVKAGYASAGIADSYFANSTSKAALKEL